MCKYKITQKGVSLIEVVISIAVLGIIMASITSYFQWSFGIFGKTDRKATAESLARSQMESIKQETYDDTGVSGDGDGIGVYTKIPFSSPYVIDLPPAVDLGNGLQKITVIVNYPDFNNPAITDNLTLEGYKQKR